MLLIKIIKTIDRWGWKRAHVKIFDLLSPMFLEEDISCDQWRFFYPFHQTCVAILRAHSKIWCCGLMRNTTKIFPINLPTQWLSTHCDRTLQMGTAKRFSLMSIAWFFMFWPKFLKNIKNQTMLVWSIALGQSACCNAFANQASQIVLWFAGQMSWWVDWCC